MGLRGGVEDFRRHDEATIEQLKRCAAAERNAPAVLRRRSSRYSMPIGGVVGYRDHVSPGLATTSRAATSRSAPIFRGRLAPSDYVGSRMPLSGASVRHGPPQRRSMRDHPVFDAIAQSPVTGQRRPLVCARAAGTVGGGNHYIDVLEDEAGQLWVGIHFGSARLRSQDRHRLEHRAGRPFRRARARARRCTPPALLPLTAPAGRDYIATMTVAGDRAYAGRGRSDRPRSSRGARNRPRAQPHNFAWKERHGGGEHAGRAQRRDAAFPVSAVSSAAAWTTSRSSSRRRVGAVRRGPVFGGPRRGTRDEPASGEKAVDFRCSGRLRTQGTVLRGAGADEAPEVYRKLDDVLTPHAATIAIEHTLRPRIVVMAGPHERDAYKD
jgi:tRNA-splicing ligase RtcB